MTERDSRVAATLSRPDVHEDWERAYRTVGAERFADRLMDRIVDAAAGPPDTMWLDAGCGPGFHSLRLARRGYRVTGIDFSEVVLEHARRTIADAGLADRISLQRGDLTQLDFPDGSFERVLCWGVLMHVPDIDAAVGELSRVLAPGGVLVVNDANRASFDNLLVALLDRSGRSSAKRKRTRAGVERWQQTPAGPLLTRQSDMSALAASFAAHGLRLRRRLAGEFSELYAYTGNGLVQGAVHRLNDLWLDKVKAPGLSQGNVLVLEKPPNR